MPTCAMPPCILSHSCILPCKAVWIPSHFRKGWGCGEAQLSQMLLTQCPREDTFSPTHKSPVQTFRQARRLLLMGFPDLLSSGTALSGTLLWSVLSAVIPTDLSSFPSSLSSDCASGALFWEQHNSLLHPQPSWKSQGTCLLC